MKMVDVTNVTLTGHLTLEWADAEAAEIPQWVVTQNGDQAVVDTWLEAFAGYDVEITISLLNPTANSGPTLPTGGLAFGADDFDVEDN